MQALHIKADVQIVHLLAQFAEGIIAIAHRILVVDGRQHVGQRRIRFNMLFELSQHRHQLRHFFGALRRRQQEQNRVEIALLRHDAVFTQIMRQNGCRDAKLTVLPTFSVNARGGQQQLAWVDKILVVRIALKTMPARVGFEAEEAALPGDRLGRVILPWTPRHHWRNKGLDHLAVSDDRFPRLNAQRHTLGPQAAAALTFMNFGVDVQRGKQRIERAGGGMQHKGVIQPLVRTETRLAAQMVILFMDLRRL